MSLAKMTLIGMSNYDPDLFKDAFFPDGIDKDLVINTLLMHGGEFEVLYPNLTFMRNSIKIWCSKWYRTFAEWYKGTQASWNPIYNYDRMEETRDESRRKSDSKTTADYSDKRTADLTDKRTVSLEDENSYDVNEKRTADLTDKRTVSLEDERTADLTEKRTADLTDKRTAALQDELISGSEEKVSNIGTDTTSQAVASTTEHLVSAYDSSSYQTSSKDIIDNGTSTVAHNNDVKNEKEGSEVNKHTGYDIMDHTGTDETATTGTDTMKHSGFDTTDHTGTDETATSGTDKTKHSGFDTLDTTGTDENVRKGTLADTSGSEQNTNIHTAHMYGNIGVTTSASMLREFYDIALWNLYEHISDVFISELLIPVY